MKILLLRPLALLAALSLNASFFGGLILDTGKVRMPPPLLPAFAADPGASCTANRAETNPLPLSSGQTGGQRAAAMSHG